MGRIFEVRKATMFKRFDRMAKQFTRIGKEIVIAVKSSGPNPDDNPALRRCYQNARSVGMPKDRVEAAIKRAMGKDTSNYEEILYEGYAPHGVAVLVETATDNTNRTVANVRSYFTKTNGSLGKTGSLDFIFKRVSTFRFEPKDLDIEELELELIDFGLEEIFVEADEEGNDIAVIHATFEDFGNMQKALEEKGIELKQAKLERIPLSYTTVTEEQVADITKLLDKLEEDEDVQAVYHNMEE